VFCRRRITAAGFLVLLLGGLNALAQGQPATKVAVLRIGTSGTLALNASGAEEAAAIDTLQSFIKSETGYENEILPQRDWTDVVQKLTKGDLQLGVLQGYEFAWAKEKHSELQPLAIAVNVYAYRDAYTVVRQDNAAVDFAQLEGQALALPRSGQEHLHLFVERQAQARGKKLGEFFSRMSSPSNVEDALDDVVEGVVQAAVVDRVALDAYKRRKPGRFSKLKPLAQTQRFPPPLVAFAEGTLDQATLQRFRDGLLNARRKERGQRLLNLFKLTSFEGPTPELDRLLEETRKAYPPPSANKK
jgi:ABC-type phosphate/phosphonate transport system substrate-binding protein